MHVLHKDHIVDIYVWVDDSLPKQLPNPLGGRPSILTQSEAVTLLVFSSFAAPQRTLKGIYRWAQAYHADDIELPSYAKFVRSCHKAMPMIAWLLEQTLQRNASLRFMDSTMLPVCKLIRADRHKVARGVAAFGKNWQG